MPAREVFAGRSAGAQDFHLRPGYLADVRLEIGIGGIVVRLADGAGLGFAFAGLADVRIFALIDGLKSRLVFFALDTHRGLELHLGAVFVTAGGVHIKAGFGVCGCWVVS